MDTIIYLICGKKIIENNTNRLVFKNYSKKDVRKIIIGNSIKYLENDLFVDCNNLTSIHINSSVTEIGNNCFKNCINLIDCDMSCGINILGNFCFNNCIKITSIILPSSIKNIGHHCFDNCTSLNKIIIDNQKYLDFCGNNIFHGINKPINIVFNGTLSSNELNNISLFLINQNNKSKDLFDFIYTFNKSRKCKKYNIYEEKFINKNKSDNVLLTNHNIKSTNPAVNFNIVSKLSRGDTNVYYIYGTIITDENIGTNGKNNITSIGNLNSKITRFEIGNGVTELGNRLFSPYKNLNQTSGNMIQSMLVIPNIPNTVTKIGSFCFNTSSVSFDRLPNSVTEIGNNCFENCGNIGNIIISSNLIGLPIACFKKCDNENFKNIIIPNSVRFLGESCFESCVYLESVNIGSGVTSIGSSCFKGCIRLTSITFMDSNINITSIGNNIFEGITNSIRFYYSNLNIFFKNGDYLKNNLVPQNPNKPEFPKSDYYVSSQNNNSISKIYLNTNLYNINELIFDKEITKDMVNNYKSYINKIYLYNVIKSEYGIFNDINNLTHVEINGTINTRGICFISCKNLTTVTICDAINKLNFDSFNNCINLRTVILKETSSLDTIENGCFNNCYNLLSPPFTNKLKFIGDCCFMNCSKFSSLDIPSSVNYISNNAFSNCTNIINIKLSDNYSGFLGSYTFSNCNNLINITPLKNQTVILEGLFMNCINLNGITLSENLIRIGSKAFYGCKKLSYLNYGSSVINVGEIKLPNTLKSIEEGAFISCELITNINYAESTKLLNIGHNAFDSCIGLKEFKIIDTITNLGVYCFYNCISLTKITIDANINLPLGCFQNCSSLETIIISTTNINSISNDCFLGCSKISSFTIPDSVTEIGKACFAYCNALQNIKFNNNITIIPEGCFNRCPNLTKIVLNNNINKISSYAFSGCYNLTSITIPESVTHLGIWCFSNGVTNPEITSVNMLNYDSNYPISNNIKNIIFEDPKKITIIEHDVFEKKSIFFKNNQIKITFKKCSKSSDLPPVVNEYVVKYYPNATYTYIP